MLPWSLCCALPTCLLRKAKRRQIHPVCPLLPSFLIACTMCVSLAFLPVFLGPASLTCLYLSTCHVFLLLLVPFAPLPLQLNEPDASYDVFSDRLAALEANATQEEVVNLVEAANGVTDYFNSLLAKRKPDQLIHLYKDFSRRLCTEREDEDHQHNPAIYAQVRHDHGIRNMVAAYSYLSFFHCPESCRKLRHARAR